MDDMTEDQIGGELAKSLIRHGVSVSAGALVAAGALNPEQSTQYITIAAGIACWLVSQAWSWIRKLNRMKEEAR